MTTPEEEMELDVEVCLEVLCDVIIQSGKIVFCHDWDSGGPGAGAGQECIYEFRGLYWPCSSTFGFQRGPFESLEEALVGDLRVLTGATVSISCPSLESDELATYLDTSWNPTQRFRINGEFWGVSDDKILRRIKS